MCSGLHLKPGMGVDVREHQWLAATETVDYTFTRVRGAANILLGGGPDFSLIRFRVLRRREFFGSCNLFGECFRGDAGAGGRNSTSNRAAGFTKIVQFRCKLCSRSFQLAYLPAPGSFAGTVSKDQEKSRCNLCIFTWTAVSKKSGAPKELNSIL